jgi:hypothetical protein
VQEGTRGGVLEGQGYQVIIDLAASEKELLAVYDQHSLQDLKSLSESFSRST